KNLVQKNSIHPTTRKLTIIPVELAQQMLNAYKKQRSEPAAKNRTKELGKKVEEPRSFWVSKEALLELMTINKADGIRFYYAIADDYPGFPLKKPDHKKIGRASCRERGGMSAGALACTTEMASTTNG